jgi:hypothetical protein
MDELEELIPILDEDYSDTDMDNETALCYDE